MSIFSRDRYVVKLKGQTGEHSDPVVLAIRTSKLASEMMRRTTDPHLQKQIGDIACSEIKHRLGKVGPLDSSVTLVVSQKTKPDREGLTPTRVEGVFKYGASQVTPDEEIKMSQAHRDRGMSFQDKKILAGAVIRKGVAKLKRK